MEKAALAGWGTRKRLAGVRGGPRKEAAVAAVAVVAAHALQCVWRPDDGDGPLVHYAVVSAVVSRRVKGASSRAALLFPFPLLPQGGHTVAVIHQACGEALDRVACQLWGSWPAADRRVSAAVGRQAIATQGEEAGGGAAAAANKPRGGSASEQCRRVGKRRAFELATEQEAALVHHSHPRWAGLSLFRRRKWGRSAQQAAPGVMAHTAGAQDGHPVAGYFHYYRHSSLL